MAFAEVRLSLPFCADYSVFDCVVCHSDASAKLSFAATGSSFRQLIDVWVRKKALFKDLSQLLPSRHHIFDDVVKPSEERRV